MSGLVLKLKPFEKLLVNGAVLQNGARATRLRVRTAGASILRLRDALHPRDAATRAGKIYFIAQLAVAGEADAAEVAADLVSLIDEAIGAASGEAEKAALVRAREAALKAKVFSVMRAVKPLLDAGGDRTPEPG